MTWFLDEHVERWARRHPDAPAIGTPAGWHTYVELSTAVQQLAGSLQAHGVRRGTLVLNALPNGMAAVVSGLAIQRAGGCVVELNAAAGAECVADAVRTTRARHVILRGQDVTMFERLDARWEAMWVARTGPGDLPERSPTTECTVPIDERGVPAERASLQAVVRSIDDLAVILFTSGSTGRPRGVMLSHRNIAANTDAIVSYLGLTAADRVMSILPLSYCYGRSLLQTHLAVGGSIFFDHRFTYPRLVLKAIADERCTGFAGVPVTFELLRRRCDPRSVSIPALRYVTQAGGATSVELRLWIRAAFAPAKFYVMYGQTEATARLTYLPPERFDDKRDSIGVPIAGVDIRIVDDEGRELGAGEVGHLIARGASVTRGYLDAPGATRDILRDGWLWTGDLARRDEDGYCFMHGRARAMLKVSGHRFSPVEVEDCVMRHPAVREACVVGAPHSLTGEEGWAFVATTVAIDAAALQRWCAGLLPAFKVPKHVVFVDALPRSVVGKVRRSDLEVRARSGGHDQHVTEPEVAPAV